METRHILLGKPHSSRVFVFGSVFRKSDPSDIDILIVYDKTECQPHAAFLFHERLIRDIEDSSGLPVDVTLLTYEEEKATAFTKRVGAIELACGGSLDHVGSWDQDHVDALNLLT